MEDQTEFNLIQKVSEWKKMLSQSGAMSKDNITELESHLLEEIDKLKTQDLNEEEAFLIAQKRMGNFASLKTEYEKINVNRSFLHKVTPYVKGMLIYLSFVSISKVLFSGIMLFGLKSGLEIPDEYILLGIIVALAMGIGSIVKSPGGIINRLNKVYILFLLALVAKPFEFVMNAVMTSHFTTEQYGVIHFHFSIFQMVIFGLLLLSSGILIFNGNKTKKLVLG